MRVRLASVLLLFTACTRVHTPALPERKPPLFTDSFDRVELGSDWRPTAAAYRLENGELVVKGAYNHPVWLLRELPRDAVIEFDAWSMSPAGDIKAEAFGDGKSFATAASYTSTGYVFIQGGWHNRLTALCRMDEHGKDRRTRADIKVEPGRRYHWLIARHSDRVEWFIDGRPVLDLVDPAPLEGPQHRFFAFNDWEAELHFDNLVIRPY
jgi:hypothetical protein